ncbi:amidase [Alkalisalibacterium limincola]|uniref:Amidase n=1 Tax=Alkalisalibacterium limincola TaxID=2699169 RepID=A0A5C8KQ48_9GAMM|nr:amidase [Alkalisalibacterium limincola]TXK62491.1 amidase [Alkalisalibacterium limincola]
MSCDPDALRRAPMVRVLRALALREVSSEALVGACLSAIERDNPSLHAWTHVGADAALRDARASDQRRAQGAALGRLDGVPVALKDSFDVEGMPTSLGLPPRDAWLVHDDASAVSRLRGCGAVILGKTAMDELAFGTMGSNPHGGDVGNPSLPGRASGGSSAGAAAALAAGHATVALGTDTLGSVRIPAAFCGLVGLKPTFGEVSRVGMAPALRRLDCPGVLARSVQDAGMVLKVLAGYDAGDVACRARRVPLALPDWDPAALRVGLVSDLRSLGAAPEVVDAFRAAVSAAGATLGHARPVSLDLAPLEVAASRRAALLLMEADILAAHGDRVEHASDRTRGLLEYARSRTAVEAMAAEQRLDGHVVAVRRLFEEFDVLVLPTVPTAPPALGAAEPANLADFTALASLAGCPALSLPLPGGMGLQLVGPRGSDLRLLELGEVVHSVIEATLEAS